MEENSRKREKMRESEWWGDRSIAEKDERFWWREESEEGGLEKKKADGEDGGDGCKRMSPKMNTCEICKLSYSNVEDSHWAVSRLTKHPAVTSFCKLTQNLSTKTARLNSTRCLPCSKRKSKWLHAVQKTQHTERTEWKTHTTLWSMQWISLWFFLYKWISMSSVWEVITMEK